MWHLWTIWDSVVSAICFPFILSLRYPPSFPLSPTSSPPLFFSPTQNRFFGGRNSEARTRITGTSTTPSLPHGWLWHVGSYSYRFMHIARMQNYEKPNNMKVFAKSDGRDTRHVRIEREIPHRYNLLSVRIILSILNKIITSMTHKIKLKKINFTVRYNW